MSKLKHIAAELVVDCVAFSSAKYIKKKLTENVKNGSDYLENFMKHFLLHKITVCPLPVHKTTATPIQHRHRHRYIHGDYMDMGVACGYLKVD